MCSVVPRAFPRPAHRLVARCTNKGPLPMPSAAVRRQRPPAASSRIALYSLPSTLYHLPSTLVDGDGFRLHQRRRRDLEHSHAANLRRRRWHKRRSWRRVGGGNRGGSNRSGGTNRCWQRLRRHWRRDDDSGDGGGTGAHHGAGAPASSILVQTSSPKQRSSSLRPLQLSKVSRSLDPRQVLFSLRLLLSQS
jgi:hypothetical protein